MTFRGRTSWLLALSGLLAAAIVAGIGIGAVGLTPVEVVGALVGPGESEGDRVARTIVWDLRLPRSILAACVGAGLAAAGAAYQGLFRNPLAEPFVIGSASGAALGATLVVVTAWQGIPGLPLSPVPIGAFLGSVGAAALTYGCASAVRTDSVAGLLLAGVAVGTLLNAVVWMLMSWNDQDMARIIAWLMGSMTGRGWDELKRIGPWLAVGVAASWLLARPLDALAEGEDTARSLGLRVGPAIAMVIAAASLAAGAAVAAAGVIGFVGLIAPHIARRLVGETYVWLVPASALIGGILLVLADTVARTLTAPIELPVGVVTAALGGPFFLYLLRRRRA